MLHTHEVTGSNPVRPTRNPHQIIENQDQPLITAAFLLQIITAKYPLFITFTGRFAYNSGYAYLCLGRFIYSLGRFSKLWQQYCFTLTKSEKMDV